MSQLKISTASPSLIMAYPATYHAATPQPLAADPAVVAELQRKGYTLEQRDGFTCLIVRVSSIIDVMGVR